jgi:hypothetical protein
MRDKYNLNTMLPSERDVDDIAGGNRDGMESEGVMIPGMAPEDRVEVIPGSNLVLFIRVYLISNGL